MNNNENVPRARFKPGYCDKYRKKYIPGWEREPAFRLALNGVGSAT